MQKVIFHSYKDINLNDVSQRQIYKQMNKLGLWKSYSIVQHKQKHLQKAAIFSFEVEFSFRNVDKRSKCKSKMECVCMYGGVRACVRVRVRVCVRVRVRVRVRVLRSQLFARSVWVC